MFLFGCSISMWLQNLIRMFLIIYSGFDSFASNGTALKIVRV